MSSAIEESSLALFRDTEAGLALREDALAIAGRKVAAVETAEQAARLADQRAHVKLLLKDIEQRRLKIVEPIKREAAAVDAEARAWSDPLKAWDHDAERALLAYRRLAEDRARREAEARERQLVAAAQRQQAAESAGKQAEADEASREIARVEAAREPAPVRGFKTDAGTTSLRRVWKVDVVNPALVPSEYLVPDLRKLQAAVDAGEREIPGCNVYEHETLPVRTR